MKAALVFALATAASATIGCQIPSTYVTTGLNGAATTCTGPAVGYQVFGVCLTGLSRTAFNIAPGTEVRQQLLATNANAFTPAGTTTATGCTVPNFNTPWNAANMGNPNQAAAITTSTTQCGALPGAPAVLSATQTPFKGIDIRCDRANGYFPVQGVEGTQICGAGAGGSFFPAVTTVPANDYFFGGSVFQSLDNTLAPNLVNTVAFSGPNQLLCAQGCVLPSSICQNGQLNANLIGVGSGFNTATCTLAPSRNGLSDTSFQFRCASGGPFANTFTATCTSASTTASLGGFGNQCGTADGALSAPLFNFNGNLDSWATPTSQLAGEINNYQQVTSVLSIAFAVQNAAYATIHHRRDWNNNPAQNLQNGNVYQIAVAGCATFAGAARIQCVQQTLNYWRCHYDFPFNGGSTCFAGGAVIACPTPALGFRCPSSSKKGLLGLLGLLALIPCLLLCCCLLLLCCIRRRKTEADVHFATFDPHAAPVVATAPCATATACPTGFGATPFATHPSAVPML